MRRRTGTWQNATRPPTTQPHVPLDDPARPPAQTSAAPPGVNRPLPQDSNCSPVVTRKTSPEVTTEESLPTDAATGNLGGYGHMLRNLFSLQTRNVVVGVTVVVAFPQRTRAGQSRGRASGVSNWLRP